jgi:hypothetical protein
VRPRALVTSGVNEELLFLTESSMKHETIKIPVCLPFDFRSMLNSHGWVDLLPNIHNPVIPSFSRVEETPSGAVVLMNVSAERESDWQGVSISMSTINKLGTRARG